MAARPDLGVITLSNRSWAASCVLVDHAVAQHAYILGLDFDDIAGFQITRRIEPRAGAGRRSRDDDVARHQRGEGRDIVDEIAEAEDQPAVRSACRVSPVTRVVSLMSAICDSSVYGVSHG